MPLILHRGILLAIILCLLMPQVAQAKEPLVIIAQDTLLGGVVGLVLGGTLTLVVDEDKRSETVRWGVVIGTFGGFGFGLWHATYPDNELFGGTDDEFGALEPTSPHFSDLMDAANAERTEIADLAAGDALQSYRGDWAVKVPLVKLSW